MKKKKLYLILTILLLVVFFLITLISCKTRDDRGDIVFIEEREQTEAEKAEEAALLDETRKKAEEYEAAKKAEEEAATKEEGSFPVEPITYTGDISGTAVILIVDFKTTNVMGSVQNVVYDDFIVTDGNIDLNTLEIKANFSGVTEKDGSGNIITISELIITGKISDDLSMFNGILLTDEGESWEFTATK